MGEMGDFSGLINGSIHISRDYRVFEGVEKDNVFLGILGMHEVALCSTVKKDWSIDDFVVCWGFAFDGECNNESHSSDSITVDKISSESDIETDCSIKNPSCPSPPSLLPCFPL